MQIECRNGLFHWCHDKSLMDTKGGEEWIFVISARGEMFAHVKQTDTIPRFQHTSFLGAEAVRVAGKLSVHSGQLRSINLHSGHYRCAHNHVASARCPENCSMQPKTERLMPPCRHGRRPPGSRHPRRLRARSVLTIRCARAPTGRARTATCWCSCRTWKPQAWT